MRELSEWIKARLRERPVGVGQGREGRERVREKELLGRSEKGREGERAVGGWIKARLGERARERCRGGAREGRERSIGPGWVRTGWGEREAV